MKNNYVIINSDTIQKRIDELNKTFKIKSGEKQALKKLVYSDNTDEILILDTEMYGLEVLLEELQNILSQSIPLNEELEEAFRNGSKYGGEGQTYFARDYISNLKLSI